MLPEAGRPPRTRNPIIFAGYREKTVHPSMRVTLAMLLSTSRTASQISKINNKRRTSSTASLCRCSDALGLPCYNPVSWTVPLQCFEVLEVPDWRVTNATKESSAPRNYDTKIRTTAPIRYDSLEQNGLVPCARTLSTASKPLLFAFDCTRHVPAYVGRQHACFERRSEKTSQISLVECRLRSAEVVMTCVNSRNMQAFCGITQFYTVTGRPLPFVHSKPVLSPYPPYLHRVLTINLLVPGSRAVLVPLIRNSAHPTDISSLIREAYVAICRRTASFVVVRVLVRRHFGAALDTRVRREEAAELKLCSPFLSATLTPARRQLYYP
ncbi:uncharacterized protein FOMMEDRAFT_152866 [Fomitiporia mediterranea MF3/22]|uniref:uncharacterized protein n=1 Tax=Fomitiporia mediterranea (strain MF3/22) TaxID=694068 RepID=UPI0004407C2D|nr:uncharacterized protein FOMMEDRAFT_152866 [Fomitiporia mediterranea MF3/22]EJD05541.1 hypothetical protein FOMMEDRAFT_152866 [Fomitiporia mediterranea MF3/22]